MCIVCGVPTFRSSASSPRIEAVVFDKDGVLADSESINLRSAFAVFPDVVPALDAMQASGLRLGVVSNWGWHAPELLQTLELARHFEVMSISARVGYQKPHRAIFEHALELLEVAPEEAIHVGDDPEADVVGARRVGIEPVLIDRHGRIDTPVGADAETGPVATIRDFGELLDLLGLARPANLPEPAS